jgi:hypothetical protein
MSEKITDRKLHVVLRRAFEMESDNLAYRKIFSPVKSVDTNSGTVFCLLASVLLCVSPVFADEADEVDESNADSSATAGPPQSVVPDLRGVDNPLTVQKGDLVAVPIPMSSPTFGTGLIAAGAYFYPQTAEQKASQPASFTGAGAAYTNNDSWAAGVGQQNYWDEDKWRFTGAVGYADFKFDLRDPATDGNTGLDWNVQGGFIQGTLSRSVADGWYLGGLLRYLDIEQDFDTSLPDQDYGVDSRIKSAGVGAIVEHDTRDMPTNAYSGRRFMGKAIFSSADGAEKESYQGYYIRLRSYHQLKQAPVVVAWDINGCVKSGQIPLWDTCRINLRGFPLTDYLGKKSISGQVEARWRVWKRWGLVAFAGAGHITNSFSDQGDNETVPSYGAGVRFMILKSKRINLRVDFARSDDSDAMYLGVAEAF